MSLSARIELLQRMPIFGAIGDDALRFILERARPVAMPSGDFFFHEGDAAKSMFVLESGRVAVLKRWDQREILVRHLEPRRLLRRDGVDGPAAAQCVRARRR